MAIEAIVIRAVREAYDALPPGDRAALRRCRDGDEVRLEGAFWRIVEAADAKLRPRLADVVACFPAASARRTGRKRAFRFGTFLRFTLGAEKRLTDAQSLRFRQLLAASDRNELVHRLRRMLRVADQPVDWGVLGCDILFWGDRARRRWAQDFYAPMEEGDDE